MVAEGLPQVGGTMKAIEVRIIIIRHVQTIRKSLHQIESLLSYYEGKIKEEAVEKEEEKN